MTTYEYMVSIKLREVGERRSDAQFDWKRYTKSDWWVQLHMGAEEAGNFGYAAGACLEHELIVPLE